MSDHDRSAPDVGLPDAKTLGDAVLAREPGALARAVALAGSGDAAERGVARGAVDAWARRTGKSVRVGLEGAGIAAIGALADRLAELGHRVAVLPHEAAPSGEGAPGASRDNPFTAVIPADGLGVADAIRACEIGGYDTVLVAVPPGWPMPPDAAVDVRIGDGTDVDVRLTSASVHADAALDALWTDVRRWHWAAIEDGTFAARRARQASFRQDG